MQVTDDVLADLMAACKALRHLDLSGCARVTDRALSCLRAKLHTLKLRNCGRVTDEGLARLRGLAQIRSLDLSYCDGITLAGLSRPLAGSSHGNDPRLEELVLRGWGYPFRVRELSWLPNLTRVDTDWLFNLEEEDLDALGSLSGLKNLKMTLLNFRYEAVMRHICGLTELEELGLSLAEDRLPEDFLPWVGRLEKLKKLRLSCRHPEGLDPKSLGGLRQIDLGGCADDETLSRLAALTDLEEIDINDTRVTDDGVASLRRAPALRKLSLRGCDIIDPAAAHLRHLSGLIELVVGPDRPDDWGGFTDVGLAALRSLSGLRALTLAFCREVTDAGLVHLSGMREMEKISLSGCEILGPGLSILLKLPRLQSLQLSGCPIEDDGLVHLEALPGLRHLDLYGSDLISDDGIGYLRSLTRLESLDLTGCGLTDAGLGRLAGMVRLRDLSLAHSGVTDAGLRHLRPLRLLRTLDLRGCAITDDSVASLRSLPRLTFLDLEDDYEDVRTCRLSDAGLRELKRDRPQLSVNMRGLR